MDNPQGINIEISFFSSPVNNNMSSQPESSSQGSSFDVPNVDSLYAEITMPELPSSQTLTDSRDVYTDPTNVINTLPRRRHAWIWNHMPDTDPQTIYMDDKDKIQWRCGYCPKIYSEGGGTRIIAHHLRTSHHIVAESARQERSQRLLNTIEKAMECARQQEGSRKRRKGDGEFEPLDNFESPQQKVSKTPILISRPHTLFLDSNWPVTDRSVRSRAPIRPLVCPLQCPFQDG